MKLTLLALFSYAPLAIYAFTGGIYNTWDDCTKNCGTAVRSIQYPNRC